MNDERSTVEPAPAALASVHSAAGDDGVRELFEARGWTDGLPIPPPTPQRVAAALEAALASRCGYGGLLGGRRTQRQRREALLARGLDEAACDLIHGPVGLRIGARSPAQIAVSIIAQLISLDRAP